MGSGLVLGGIIDRFVVISALEDLDMAVRSARPAKRGF